MNKITGEIFEVLVSLSGEMVFNGYDSCDAMFRPDGFYLSSPFPINGNEDHFDDMVNCFEFIGVL